MIVFSNLSPPCLTLPDDYAREHLLTQLGLSALDGGHEHVTDTGGGQAIEPTLDAAHGDNLQRLGARVIGAVDGRRIGQTQRQAVLVTLRTSTSYEDRGGGRRGVSRGQGRAEPRQLAS
jgi:hypothetical protein